MVAHLSETAKSGKNKFPIGKFNLDNSINSGVKRASVSGRPPGSDGEASAV